MFPLPERAPLDHGDIEDRLRVAIVILGPFARGNYRLRRPPCGGPKSSGSATFPTSGPTSPRRSLRCACSRRALGLRIAVAPLLLNRLASTIVGATRTTRNGNQRRETPTSHGKEITVSGFALWSVLHPRIDRYLDDPSRDRHTPRVTRATPAVETAAPVETDSDLSSAQSHQAASDPLAA